MNAPLSLVTVTYSPGEHIRNLYDSLDAAATQDMHLVMADNGSVDGAPELLDAQTPGLGDHAHVSTEFFPTGGNIGYGAALNKAVEHLKPLRDAGEIDSEYFVVVNPDVVFSPGALDALRAVSDADSAVAVAGPLIFEPDGTIYPSARSVPTLGSGIGHALFVNVWPSNPWTHRYRNDQNMSHEREAGWLSGSCLFVRWDAFDQIDGFDENYFMYMEDVDLGDRMARAGWKNIFTPSAQIMHAQGHSADQHKEFTLKAHHKSAYQFQKDRLSAWWQAPIRWSLWVALQARCAFQVAHARRATKD